MILPMAEDRIVVVGLGYVGLPLAVELAKRFEVVGIDKDARRIEQLKAAYDRTGEISNSELIETKASWETDLSGVRGTFYIIAVPTPVDERNDPDFRPLDSATRWVGERLKSGDVVCYESTVYPGATEERCLPILLKESKLRRKDIGLGYSPERINPGDREHTLRKVTKVVSADSPETMERVAFVYTTVAPIYEAKSIRAAEAAKVIENTQRDLNIALMNELSLIFEKMDLRTEDVLAAARTKWNFLDFKPGLVGGHCIGVDPYYLTYKARELGYHPEVILAGRRVNDSMSTLIAHKTLKLMHSSSMLKISRDASPRLAHKNYSVAVLGVTFKENCPDIRNSKVPALVRELRNFGCHVKLYDPLADKEKFYEEYELDVENESVSFSKHDAVILAVPHKEYVDPKLKSWIGNLLPAHLFPGGILVDVKSILQPKDWVRYKYWSL
jgi:UDP-N-acetyl-D-galactosamine dehydrogenase